MLRKEMSRLQSSLTCPNCSAHLLPAGAAELSARLARVMEEILRLKAEVLGRAGMVVVDNACLTSALQNALLTILA